MRGSRSPRTTDTLGRRWIWRAREKSPGAHQTGVRVAFDDLVGPLAGEPARVRLDAASSPPPPGARRARKRAPHSPVHPPYAPWGQKAFAGYLGDDRAAWDAHDSCALLRAGKRWPGTALVDQGLADKFLDRELRPELLEAAAADTGASLSLRRHPGYDHSYFFVASLIDHHLRHHAAALGT